MNRDIQRTENSMIKEQTSLPEEQAKRNWPKLLKNEGEKDWNNAFKIAGGVMAAASLALAGCNPVYESKDSPTRDYPYGESPTTSDSNLEKINPEKPLGGVLRFSEQIYIPETKTWRDNILDSTAVTKYFLSNKFHFT